MSFLIRGEYTLTKGLAMSLKKRLRTSERPAVLLLLLPKSLLLQIPNKKIPLLLVTAVSVT